MPLKARLTADEHKALAEGLRGFYREEGGAFLLDAEGVEDVSGLKRTLEDKKADVVKLRAKIEELQKQFDGLDPEKARTALAELDKLRDKQLMDEGKVEELITKRTDRLRADADAKVAALTTRNAELEQTIKARDAKLSEVLIDSAIAQRAPGMGVKAAAMPVLTLIAKQGLPTGKVPRWVVEGDQPVPKDMNGTVVIGKDARTPMSLDEWFGVLKSEVADLFEPSEGANVSARGGGGAGGGRFSMSRKAAESDFSAYKSLQAEAEKAGQRVTLTD